MFLFNFCYQVIKLIDFCFTIIQPPIPEIGREIDKDDEKPFEINGYRIPPGTWLQVSSYMCARDEKNFPDPYRFKPERFSKESDDM